MPPRPKIPRELEREILLEAGHRCAIPTCKYPTTELAHIIPWSKVKKHEFDNLIALCPNCHTRYDKGEIDRKSMVHYKTNLSIINSRYGDIERRLLQSFAFNAEIPFHFPKHQEIFLWHILDDGLITKDEMRSCTGGLDYFYLTEKGKEFVNKWINAEPIE